MPRKTRIRKVTSEAERHETRRQREVMETSALVGVPEAQRDPARLVVITSGIDGKARGQDRTVWHADRVQMLLKSKAISKEHAAAIKLYVEAHERAHAGIVGASRAGGGGSGDVIASTSSMISVRLDRIDQGRRYDRARGCLPRPYVAAFERVVLDNHPLGDVGRDQWPGMSAGSVSHNLRKLVSACADCLLREFRDELDTPAAIEARVSLVGMMLRMDARVKGGRG